jgi:hypothetical protein
MMISIDPLFAEVNAALDEAQAELRVAELRVAELSGQRAMLLRLIQQPTRTDGEGPEIRATD